MSIPFPGCLGTPVPQVQSSALFPSQRDYPGTCPERLRGGGPANACAAGSGAQGGGHAGPSPSHPTCSPASGGAGAQERLPLGLASQARHNDSPHQAARQLSRHLLLLLGLSCQTPPRLRVRADGPEADRRCRGSVRLEPRGSRRRSAVVVMVMQAGKGGTRPEPPARGCVLREPRPALVLLARRAGS